MSMATPLATTLLGEAGVVPEPGESERMYMWSTHSVSRDRLPRLRLVSVTRIVTSPWVDGGSR